MTTLSASLAGLVNQVLVEETKAKKTTTKAKVKKAVAKTVEKVTKPKLPANVVFYRADRNKWIATNAQGQQEAARKTEAAAYAFLLKKYNVKGKAFTL